MTLCLYDQCFGSSNMRYMPFDVCVSFKDAALFQKLYEGLFVA